MRKEHNPYQSVADREREAKKREADRRLEQDRQRYKEVRLRPISAISARFVFSLPGWEAPNILLIRIASSALFCQV